MEGAGLLGRTRDVGGGEGDKPVILLGLSQIYGHLVDTSHGIVGPGWLE